MKKAAPKKSSASSSQGGASGSSGPTKTRGGSAAHSTIANTTIPETKPLKPGPRQKKPSQKLMGLAQMTPNPTFPPPRVDWNPSNPPSLGMSPRWALVYSNPLL